MVRPDTVRYFFVVRESLLGHHFFFFSVSLVLFVCFKDENGFFVCLFILFGLCLQSYPENWSPAALCRCQHVDLMIDLEFWSAFPVGLEVCE